MLFGLAVFFAFVAFWFGFGFWGGMRFARARAGVGLKSEYQSLHARYTAALQERDQQLATLRQRHATADELFERTQALLIACRAATGKIAQRLVKDSIKTAQDKLSSSNYATTKTKLQALFEFCARQGYIVAEAEQTAALQELRQEYELTVRQEVEREEQARIKARIREEQREEKEREQELKKMESERAAVEKALEQALRKTKDEHSAEVEQLRAKLQEAEARQERAKSQAQLTKAGYVYVISNLGSFGEHVYKVGMTRRLVPMERVQELGDASVPFEFDVHMMISCDDAPALESQLHRELHTRRLNRVNLRKEFFRVELQEIVSLVEQHHGKVEYTADAEALEFRESTAMTDQDFAFVSAQKGEAAE